MTANFDDYQNEWRGTSAPAALWAQLQELEQHRASVRTAILRLVDKAHKPEISRLLNEQECLTVQWHRMFLDSLEGVTALSNTPIAEALQQSIHK